MRITYLFSVFALVLPSISAGSLISAQRYPLVISKRVSPTVQQSNTPLAQDLLDKCSAAKAQGDDRETQKCLRKLIQHLYMIFHWMPKEGGIDKHWDFDDSYAPYQDLFMETFRELYSVDTNLEPEERILLQVDRYDQYRDHHPVDVTLARLKEAEIARYVVGIISEHFKHTPKVSVDMLKLFKAWATIMQSGAVQPSEEREEAFVNLKNFVERHIEQNANDLTSDDRAFLISEGWRVEHPRAPEAR